VRKAPPGLLSEVDAEEG